MLLPEDQAPKTRILLATDQMVCFAHYQHWLSAPVRRPAPPDSAGRARVKAGSGECNRAVQIGEKGRP